MRILPMLTLLAAVAASAPLTAQTPRPRQALRSQIEETFLQRISTTLGTTPDQNQRMREVILRAGEVRRDLEQEERDLRARLQRELRPGVAARPDSVSMLVDGITRNRIAYAQSFHDEMQELAPILTPVQRGLYLQMRDQLLMRVRDLQQARQAPPGARRP